MEREFRIEQSEFPINAQHLISPHIQDSKRIRYYQEIDGNKKSFEVKFKKRRLHYSIEFDESGALEDVEFKISPVDIPDESWKKITDYLKRNFGKFSIKKIQQQHPLTSNDAKKTLVDAFQNLLLPHINYEIVFSAKKEKFERYEALFNADGEFVRLRKSVSTKYDHVLY